MHLKQNLDMVICNFFDDSLIYRIVVPAFNDLNV